MGQPNSKSDPQTNSQWEWKSNPNPFSKTEEAQWTPYNLLDNYLLEKAYYNQQEQVDLGDYVVSIKDMLQTRKDNRHRQRPIRRNTEYFKNEEEEKLDQDENIRAKRFFGAETPKTYNKAFGNLEDYLRFFQNRGPEVKQFAKFFNDAENTNNLDFFNKIVQPCLIDCLQKESKKMPKKKEQYERELLQLFQGTVKSIQQFYANVLKAYTMGGFLYQNLNRYLRNEDWIQLDSLLPYAYCLCKAFLRQEFTTSNLSSPQKQASMIVYRGAQFDEVTLSFYDLDTIKTFCWNSVTSTSRSRFEAEKFMYRNFDPKKVPTLFIIEVPLSSENTSTWIDIKPYSAIPNEDEVVLPPGTVFELISVSRTNKSTVEINLKLMVDVKQLAHQGQIMHGAMHSEMGNDTSLKLVCLEGKELSDALTHLKGNRLIEKLEFCLCRFDDDKVATVSLEKMPRLKRLLFISSFAGNEVHWRVLLKHLERVEIEKLQISDGMFNDNLLKTLGQGLKGFTSLRSLTLDFYSCYENITDEGLNYLSSQGLKYLTLLTSLDLNFSACEKISNEGLNSLCSIGLRKLTSLTSLTLHFQYCFRITDEGLKSLSCQGLKYLTSLTSLTLDFYHCFFITDEGLNHLALQGLKYLSLLRSLSLHFSNYDQITDEGLNNLSSQGLKYLTSLTSLVLHLTNCDQITDEGLNYLAAQGTKNLASLTSLTLCLEYCGKITNEAKTKLESFWKLKDPEPKKFQKVLQTTFVRELKNKSSALKEKTSDKDVTTSANMIIFERRDDFDRFTENILAEKSQKVLSARHQIVIKGDQLDITLAFSKLLNKRVDLSTVFADLTVSFHNCVGLSDQVLNLLSSHALKNLTSLTSLTIHFQRCFNITDKALNHLSSQGLKYLTSLTSLVLGFSYCSKITDEGLNYLASQGLKCLTSLRSLALDFRGCNGITDEGLNQLSSQGLKDLTSLTSLIIDFERCNKITDKGLNHLSSQGLKYLTSLTSLALHFEGCDEIAEEGLNHLSSQGLKYLTSLTSLTLDFHYCKKITDEGLNHLSSQGLKYLTSLTSLELTFRECPEITGEGLNRLSTQGLKCLTSLVSLTLDFARCNKITDKELSYMCSQGLKYLTSLTSLILDFQSCNKIDVDTWNNFCKVLKYLGFEILRKDAIVS